MRPVLLGLVLLAACGAKPKVEDPAAPAPAAPEAAPAAPAAVVYTLKELQNGDAACYVVLSNAAGEPVNYPGSFELCPGASEDASALVGKTVTITVGRQKIMAGSCEGNPECPDTEEVDFVTAVAAAG